MSAISARELRAAGLTLPSAIADDETVSRESVRIERCTTEIQLARGRVYLARSPGIVTFTAPFEPSGLCAPQIRLPARFTRLDDEVTPPSTPDPP